MNIIRVKYLYVYYFLSINPYKLVILSFMNFPNIFWWNVFPEYTNMFLGIWIVENILCGIIHVKKWQRLVHILSSVKQSIRVSCCECWEYSPTAFPQFGVNRVSLFIFASVLFSIFFGINKNEQQQKRKYN